jgi:hypothetical protein
VKQNNTATACVVALILGGAIVAASLARPDTTPCADMARLSGEVVALSTAIVEALDDRAASATAEDRAVATAEVEHLTAALDAISPNYDAAQAACLEVSR